MGANKETGDIGMEGMRTQSRNREVLFHCFVALGATSLQAIVAPF